MNEADSITPAVSASQRSIKNNFRWLTPLFNQHVVYKWLCMSVEREIGYIKVGSLSAICSYMVESVILYMRKDRPVPLPLLILGSRPRATVERYVLPPGGILYGCGSGRLSGFLGVVWVFSGWNESRRVKTLFPVFCISLEKTSHHWGFFWDSIECYSFPTSDLGYCHPFAYNLFISSAFRGGWQPVQTYWTMVSNRAAGEQNQTYCLDCYFYIYSKSLRTC